MLTHLVNLKHVRPRRSTSSHLPRTGRCRRRSRPGPLARHRRCSGGDSEYTIPTGYSDTHVDWTSTVDARVIDVCGHLHDIDIIDPNPCPTHCPERGGGIALSAEVVGGPPTDYFGPIPPNNPPPSDITGRDAMPLRGELRNALRAATRRRGHLDTMGHCGIFSELPGARSPRRIRPAAATRSRAIRSARAR